MVALMVSLLAGAAGAQSKSAAAFERMKTLVGEWEGKLEDGTTGRISCKLISNGTAVLESIYNGEHPDGMVTVYHLDGDSLLATHFCSAGNQPRMRARPGAANANELVFKLVDVGNRLPSQDSQITGLTVRFEDADHFAQEWSGDEKGKESTMVFRWTRKK
jgi:hypothetical protein